MSKSGLAQLERRVEHLELVGTGGGGGGECDCPGTFPRVTYEEGVNPGRFASPNPSGDYGGGLGDSLICPRCHRTRQRVHVTYEVPKGFTVLPDGHLLRHEDGKVF